MHELLKPLASAESASEPVACMRRGLRERHDSRQPVGTVDREVDAVGVLKPEPPHEGKAP